MIRLWLSRRVFSSIQEQLSAQLVLGILSGKLAPGDKLPSVRELARRLKIHGNTVHAVYRDLAKRGWVQGQQGSGVFVRLIRPAEGRDKLDEFVRAWLKEAQANGYSVEDLQSAIERQVRGARPERLVVVDSDGELARVLAAEISAGTGKVVESVSLEEAAGGLGVGACLLVNPGQAMKVSRVAGGLPLSFITLRSMQDVLGGAQRPAKEVLIAVVSRSNSILEWARLLLSSLGFDADDLLFRNPAVCGWRDGLSICDIVAADALAARELPTELQPLVFHVVAEETFAEVRRMAG